MNNQRNMILAVVLSAIILFGWNWATQRWFPVANPPATKIAGGKTTALSNPAAPSAAVMRDRRVVLAEGKRVPIRTPRLGGSINLVGARFDDLVLLDHTMTVAKGSPPVRLLSPQGAPQSYFSGFGWTSTTAGVAVPGPDTLWQANGAVLSPGKPLTLSWTNPTGQSFLIRLAIDTNYMITVDQAVANAGAAPVTVQSFGYITRDDPSVDLSSWTMHIGPMGVFNGTADYSIKYTDLDAPQSRAGSESSKGGWLGFGDKYWLTALIPDGNQTVATRFSGDGNVYQADFARPAQVVAPGQTATQRARLFAGAKEIRTLDHYQDQEGVERFSYAVDWGWFRVVEKPIFYYLDWLFRLIGNFGVAIIILTITVRLAVFPLAQHGFRSMAQMRIAQPKIKALQERYADDRVKMQQEVMALYRQEKISPMSGCLPMLLQFPIFYALYKVLSVAVEMRHQPFALWIKDLSAPDPLTPVNLFGLLNFTPPHMLAIGVIPIILGITQYFQFKLNPQAMDPTQQKMFAIMPWVMMFMMASFAVGLQIYWIVSNIWSIAQQRFLYMRHPEMRQTAPAATAALVDRGADKPLIDLAGKAPAKARVTRTPAPKPPTMPNVGRGKNKPGGPKDKGGK